MALPFYLCLEKFKADTIDIILPRKVAKLRYVLWVQMYLQKKKTKIKIIPCLRTTQIQVPT